MQNIKAKYSREYIISRISGLFPYATYENGRQKIHSAIEKKNGCYGQIMPNFCIPVDFYVEGKSIIKGGKVYTYRQMMDVYYEYYKSYPDEAFIKFVENGIGREKIDGEAIGLGDKKKYPLLPESVMLSDAMELYEEIGKMKKSCELGIKSSDCKSCLECDKFMKMGGDVFMEYLLNLHEKAKKIAEEYLSYVSNDKLTISFNVPIFQTKRDMGYQSCYINEWVPGNRYYCGDFVTYQGTTYVCVLNHFIQDMCGRAQNECRYTICGDRFYAFDEEIMDYAEEELHHVCSIELLAACGNAYEYVECGGNYYKYSNDTLKYEEITVCEYTTGVFDEETGTIVFDYAHFMPLCDYVNQYGLSIGENNDNIVDGWYCADNVYGTHFKIFHDVADVPSFFDGDYVRHNGTIYKWNKITGVYSVDTDNGMIYRVEGKSESNISYLRSRNEFIDLSNKVVKPSFGEDFLFYYNVGKVGNVSCAYEEETNNILRWKNTILTEGEIADDLYAYGDVLIDIQVNPNNRELKFMYVLGAHLNSVCQDVSFDDMMRLVYRYNNVFYYDENDKHGIKYYETYTYEYGGELDKMVLNGDFEEYINRTNDIILFDVLEQTYIRQGVDVKYEGSVSMPSNVYLGYDYIVNDGEGTEIGDFWKWNGASYINYSQNVSVRNYTGQSMAFYAKSENIETVNVDFYNKNFEYSFISSEYGTDVENTLDYLYSPLYRKDYMVGVSYEPNVIENVTVGRGNAASMERHISLGDVKSFEDLVDFRNGGFFNIVD